MSDVERDIFQGNSGPEPSSVLVELNNGLTSLVDSLEHDVVGVMGVYQSASFSLVDYCENNSVYIDGNPLLQTAVIEMLQERLEKHDIELQLEDGDLIFSNLTEQATEIQQQL